YVEVAGNHLILRPHNQSSPIEVITMEDGKTSADYLVGRICHVGLEALIKITRAVILSEAKDLCSLLAPLQPSARIKCLRPARGAGRRKASRRSNGRCVLEVELHR